MENNPGSAKRSGLSRCGLRLWGLLFAALGMISRSILQAKLLGMGQISGEELLAVMQDSENAMLYAALALILQALETCAVPIFAFLLLEGFQHTASFKGYVLRVAAVALASEIPFNLAVSGKVLDPASRNPAFGLVIGLVVLYLYRHFGEPTSRDRVIKVLVTVAALLWSSMLRIELGAPLTLILCVLWALRSRPLYRNLAGVTACVVCTLISPFFLASPMGLMPIHFYNGETGRENRIVICLAYPLLLLIVGLAALFLF